MERLKITAFFLVLTFFGGISKAQNDSIGETLKISAYLDFYYAYDLNRPPSRNRAVLANNSIHIFSHHRHNEMTINHGGVFLAYNNSKVRGAMSLHTGTYVQSNYANEPQALRFIYEASAGYRIHDNLWIDAGIFPSHIGSETAISSDNYTLSRSLMADNTPYYESGVKATFSKGNKLRLCVLLLNGWQNIRENNDNKAIGTQLTISPNDNILFNSSTFFGKEAPAYDTMSTRRYFHNFYTQITHNKLKLLAAFDIGIQDGRAGRQYNIWYNPNLIMRYDVTVKYATAIRVEYYHDKSGVIINPGRPNGFQTFSPSLNIDYKISDNLVWRIESRAFRSRYPVYEKGAHLSRTNYFILTSVCLKFP